MIYGIKNLLIAKAVMNDMDLNKILFKLITKFQRLILFKMFDESLDS